ncbi:MAG: DUF4976 domain-containing protein [Bacteroidales bacterium]|nr:DUF4976 domain-containing protein [Bacteroidales bacterium]
MIIYSPNQKNKGKQTFAITELVDMFPSLCEMCGIEVPDYMEGTSFVPLLEDPDKEWKTAAFSQFHRRPRITPDGKRYMGYSMKTNKYHYVEWYYWDNETKQKGEYVTNELYDNEIDPHENENIAGSEENNALIKELSNQLAQGWRAAKPSIER